MIILNEFCTQYRIQNWFIEYETRKYWSFSSVHSSRTIHRRLRGGITAGEGGGNVGTHMNAYRPVKDAKQNVKFYTCYDN